MKCSPPDKSALLKIIFRISQPKHMLWVLKRTISMSRFFQALKIHVYLMGKKLITISCSKKFRYLDVCGR